MINVRKEIIGYEKSDGFWNWTILVVDNAAAYSAVGKSKRVGREDAIKSLRHFLKQQGYEVE